MILSIESSCDDSAIAITDIKTKKGNLKPPTPLDTQLAQSSINATF